MTSPVYRTCKILLLKMKVTYYLLYFIHYELDINEKVLLL